MDTLITLLDALSELLTPEVDRLLEADKTLSVEQAQLHALGRELARRRALKKLGKDQLRVYRAMLALQKANGGKPIRASQISSHLLNKQDFAFNDDSTRWRKLKALEDKYLVVHEGGPRSPFWLAIEVGVDEETEQAVRLLAA